MNFKNKAWFLILFILSCGEEKLDLTPFESGKFGVGVVTRTFYDTSRKTPSAGSFPEESSRTLVTEIWYPSTDGTPSEPVRNGNPYTKEGPYPLIIFAHGAMSFRTQSTFLCKHLASHGYVVFSPDFPLSSFKKFTSMNPADVMNQPGDVSFLITKALELSTKEGDILYNMISSEKIGVTGHSLGGLTSILAGFYEGLKDERIKAVAPISPFACFLKKDVFEGKNLPLLIIGGDKDMFVKFDTNIERIYEYAEAPKFMILLKNGTHLGSLDLDISEPLAFTIFSSVMKALATEEAENSFYNFLNTIGDISQCENLYENYIENGDINFALGYSKEFMLPEKQRNYEKAFILAFFNVYLKGYEEWKKFLNEEYGKKFKDLVIKSSQ